jgi:uncharacterized repeat protein (TIGR03809 family)
MGSVMSGRPPGHALDEVAHKWHALAERRQGHFVELLQSGRWRHYYSKEQFLDRLREAIRMSDRWEEIARAAAGDARAQHADAEPSHRSAA